MTGWIGGDTEQMRELGRVFGEQAEHLRGAVGRLRHGVQRIAWQGTDLDDFAATWSSRYAVEVLAVADVLTAGEAVLDANAQDQDGTSADPGTVGGGVVIVPGKLMAPRIDGDRLAQDFRDALYGDPAALQAWWESLSDREVAELIRQNPGLVLSLQQYGFLDPHEYAKAWNAWLADVQSDAVASGESWSLSGGIAIPVYKIVSVDLASDVGLDLLEMGDGTYQVVVRGGAGLGASVGDDDGMVGAGLELGADGNLVYRFDSREEADAFMAALGTAVLPDDPLEAAIALGGLATSTVPGLGSGVLSAYAGRELAEVLTAHGADLESVTGRVDVAGGGSAIAASLTGERGGSVSWNPQDGTYSIGVDQTFDASGSLPVVGSGQIAAQLTLDPSGRETSLQVSGDVAVLFGQSPPGLPTGIGVNGAGVSGSITVDLTDPRNYVAAEHLAAAVAQGDTAAAQAAVSTLYENSAVVFQADALSGSQAEINAEVISGGYGYTRSDQLGLWVKPPGTSDYQQVG